MNKYKEALNELSYPLDDSSCGGCKCGTSDCQDCEKAQAVFTLEQLINEHFDNPPLKFEELRKYIGQPIWDNKERKYRLIKSISYCGYWIKFVHTIDSTISEGYEENRFYRYEVKEDD